MQIHQEQSDISIVILAELKPGKLSPKWLLNKGVITQDEWNDQDENIVVAPPTSHFRLGNSLEWFCDEKRLQVRSLDITKSSRIIDFLLSILRVIPDLNIKAIGINAGLLFSFQSEKDSEKFNDHFSNNNFMSDFISNPTTQKIIYEEQVEASADFPKRTITFAHTAEKTITLKEKDTQKETIINIPLWSVNLNNHFVITSIVEASNVISKAEVIHTEFRDTCNKMFSKI